MELNSLWMKAIRTNKVSYAIFFYLIIFSLFHYVLKPSMTYYPDGSFRPFGLEYTDETFLPIWLVSLVMGMLSYLFILYLCSVAPSSAVAIRNLSVTKRYRRG